jgi:hypothetical protein
MKEFRLCLLYIEHWLRTSYICCLWSNAELDDVYASLPLPEESGWAVSNGEYAISTQWEDRTKMDDIGQAINQMLHGCKCRKGCSSSRCGWM